jgi:hypothetical protein
VAPARGRAARRTGDPLTAPVEPTEAAARRGETAEATRTPGLPRSASCSPGPTGPNASRPRQDDCAP